jgi:hypothetical protein
MSNTSLSINNIMNNELPEISFYTYTIPHTGTNFLFHLLYTLNCDSNVTKNDGKTKFLHYHARDTQPTGRLMDAKIFVTVRDPYQCLISHISRQQKVRSIDEIIHITAHSWNIFLRTLPTINYKPLFINCPENIRYSHVTDVLSFVFDEKTLDKYDSNIRKYCAVWKPQNVYKRMSKNPLQIYYKKNPKELYKHDLSELDEAVSWYHDQFNNIIKI